MEDKFLIELLDSKYQEARDRFRDGKHSHEDLTIMMLKHQTNHIAHLEIDLNSKIEEQGRSLNTKIEEQGRSLNAKIEEQGRSLNAKIEEQGRLLNAKIEEQGRLLNAKIDEQGKKIDEQGRSINQRIDKLEVKVDSNFKWLLSTVIAMGVLVIAVITYLR